LEQLALSSVDGPVPIDVLNRLSWRKEYYLDANNQVCWRVPDIREAVRAPLGRKIFSADFSQIEIKIMAWLSQDPFLLDAINSGKDIHSYIASGIFKIPYDEFYYAVKHKEHPKHKEYATIRSNTKTTVFGTPYGAGARRVAAMTGLTEEKAQEFIDNFFAQMPVLKAWLDQLRKDAVQNRMSRSARGRVRWYDVPARKDTNYRKVLAQIERFAGNMPIQATCVDMLKPALAYFYLAVRGQGPVCGIPIEKSDWAAPKKYDAAILLAVHDEIVGECDEKDAGNTATPGVVPELLKLSMEFAYTDLTTKIKKRDEDGILREREIAIRDIPNKVDVVVNDYWSKD
jgi:DNA polymerase-1